MYDTIIPYNTNYISQRIEKLEDNELEYKLINYTLDYISKKKRIIYGGLALHLLLLNENRSGIYSNNSMPDIDLYSPEAFDDWIYLCKNFVKDYSESSDNITGRQAEHQGTYTILVKHRRIIDLSEIPNNIFVNLPSVNVKFMKYNILIVDIPLLVAQHYLVRAKSIQISDMFRKHIKRITLMKTEFKKKMLFDLKIPKNSEEWKDIVNQYSVKNKDIKRILKLIKKKIIKNNKHIILLGIYGFKKLAQKITKNNDINKYFKNISVNSYAFACSEPDKITKDILSLDPELKEEVYNEFIDIIPFEHRRILYKDNICVILFKPDTLCISSHYIDKKYRIGTIDSLYYWWYSLRIYGISVKSDYFIKKSEYILRFLNFFNSESFDFKGKDKYLESFKLNCALENIKDDRILAFNVKRKVIVFNPNKEISKIPNLKKIDGSKKIRQAS